MSSRRRYIRPKPPPTPIERLKRAETDAEREMREFREDQARAEAEGQQILPGLVRR